MRRLPRKLPLFAGVILLAAVTLGWARGGWAPSFGEATKAEANARQNTDWRYAGGAAGQHYSPLTQIDRSNVAMLKVAWTFDLHEKGGLQTTPLVVDGRMFVYGPKQRVIALDAATGRELWTSSPESPGEQPVRGFSYWRGGGQGILFAAALSKLYALDPETGKPLPGFGEGGFIDLRKGLGEDDAHGAYKQGFVAMTTPGTIYKDSIIVGFRAPETEPALRGDIRAFDVHTGALRWQFHTIPHPGEAGYDTWPADAWKTSGAANDWAGFALDEQRGIVYAPTGSAVNDFYGDDRIGADLYADTLLALDANTGKRLWHFQGVHHDIWDRDFPSAPVLLTVDAGGRRVDAVAQTTKQGFVFLFDRVTGKPLFPIEEKAFPQTAVPGEQSWPTQPIPLAPAAYARQRLTEDLLTTRTPEVHQWAVEQFRTFKGGGLFVPLGVDTQTIIFPGFDGGAEWGGPAVDPATSVLFVNANDLPWTAGLTASKRGGSVASQVYAGQCAVCHGMDRKGAPPAFPSLVGVEARLSSEAIAQVIHNGKGRMPAFPVVDGPNLTAMLAFLKSGETPAGSASVVVTGGDRSQKAGAALYDRRCAICHGDDLLGSVSNIPGLVGVGQRMSAADILLSVREGKGRMPAYHMQTDADAESLLRFLRVGPVPVETSSKKEMASGPAALGRVPAYRFTGYHKFLDPDGYPAVKPPWGTLNAIDMNTGKYLWKVPLGEYPELAAKGMKDTGSENYGGPVVTASGLVFIAATNFDRKIRAFDSSNGKLLWEAELPFAGNATPAIYMVKGKEYLVIAASGARDTKGPKGCAYVAFALP